MTINRREFIVLGGAATLLASTGTALADNWPNKAVTVISPYPPGGGSDIIARLVADVLTAALGQQFVIENLAGASGALGAGKLARSKPDGYTLLVSASAPLAANKVVQKGLAYDPQADFTPASLVAETPLLLTCSKNAPAKTLKEFIDYAKKNPGKVNYGTPGAGTKGHIAAAIIAQRAGIEINHIPYKGSPPLLADLLGGHIDFALDTASNYIPHIDEGKIGAVAATSAKRIPRLPNVPTVAEQGMAGYEATLWFGAVGPKGMPPEIARKISDAVNAWLAKPEAVEKLASLGMVPLGGAPERLGKAIDLEIASIRPVVEAGLIQPN
ncbi:Bug family tripartite tricarboxylate transporter substrate binding protein [Rhizobium terrae]|uniref:Bug family tripartite tricarboxylate transporter substrate binding protein n=1 Tax=Rhizobium terrae TaxID=2171756 RepID=UPI000E3B7253|nr:tripartite tricarboxylate transporter substrate binding protein [Rhizobium terrae]